MGANKGVPGEAPERSGVVSGAADFAAEAERISEIRDPTDRLVRSGVLALIHAGRAVLETGLSPEVITRTAGRSRRSYYDHFRGKQHFSEQLFDELLGVGGVTKDRLNTVEMLMDFNDGDLFESLRLMATAPALGNAARVNRVARQIVSGLGANDDYARARIDDFYERDRLTYEVVITSLLDSWGLEFREPWTAETATTFFRVVVDGYAMRSLMQPEIDETEAVLLVFKSVFRGMVRLGDSADTDSVDDQLREVSDMAKKYLRERSDPSVVLDARQAIQDATMTELKKRGFANTNLDLVARLAGISQVTIRRAMGDLDDICCDMLYGLLAGLESAAELDVAGPTATDSLSVIKRHFERVCVLVADYRPLMDSISFMLLTPSSANKAQLLVEDMERILRILITSAIDDGTLAQASPERVATGAKAINSSILRSSSNLETAAILDDARTLFAMLFGIDLGQEEAGSEERDDADLAATSRAGS